METMRRIVLVVCAALLFVPVVMKNRMNQDIPAHTVFRVLSSGRMSVKVSGDVRHPGIYEVSAKSMAHDVIIMARPVCRLKPAASEPADRPLLNGSAVHLSLQPDGSCLVTTEQMSVSERLVLGIPLDISTMSENDFDRLPGIGPAMARRITEYRQNNGGILRVTDLKDIEGIGEKRYKVLMKYFQLP